MAASESLRWLFAVIVCSLLQLSPVVCSVSVCAPGCLTLHFHHFSLCSHASHCLCKQQRTHETTAALGILLLSFGFLRFRFLSLRFRFVSYISFCLLSVYCQCFSSSIVLFYCVVLYCIALLMQTSCWPCALHSLLTFPSLSPLFRSCHGGQWIVQHSIML